MDDNSVHIAEFLRNATGLSEEASETPSEFSNRVLNAVNKLENDDWDKLPDFVQKWCNAANAQRKRKGTVPALGMETNDENEENVMDANIETVADKAPKKSRAKLTVNKDAAAPKGKKAAKAPSEPKPEKAKPAPKVAPERKPSALSRAHAIMVEKRLNITIEDLHAALEKEGFSTSKGNIGGVKGTTLAVLKALADQGLLKSADEFPLGA